MSADSSSSESGTDPSGSPTTVDPDSSSSDPTTVTINPDSSSSDPTDPTDPTAESSSTDPTDPTDATESSSGTGELCGNGAIDMGEDCDGDELGAADCISEGFDAGELACDACAFDTSGCIMFSCGNDAIEGKEICDGADLGGADCVSEGFPLGGELGCAPNCGDFDTSACITEICGNDAVEGGETCDGMDLNGQDCTTQGFDEGNLACNDDCGGFDTSGCASCGDGLINGTEACDGVDLNGVTCADLGFDGGTPTCAADCSGVISLGCLEEQTQQYCVQPNAAILDLQTTLSQINVAGNQGTVTDVNVSVTATHTWTSDLTVAITHLDSVASTQLFSLVCGSGDNIDATFDQDAPGFACSVGIPAISGTMAPEAPGNLDAVAAAVGNGNGTWELSVADGAGGDIGNLSEWCVEITSLEPVGALPDSCRQIGEISWCFNDDACGQACDDVCADLGMNLDISDADWFAAQDEVAECQAISDAFGMVDPIQVNGWTYACLEDGGENDTVGGGLTGSLFCSTDAGCPAQHRTNMDQLGIECGQQGARRSICPCNGAGAQPGQQDFGFTGGEQQFVVPPGVFSVHIVAFGGQGGDATNNVDFCGATDVPGLGGTAEGDLAVTPGEVLSVFVGGAGGAGNTPGFNGGGGACADTATCSGGGGASDVRQNGNALGNRVLVAGGAGGTEWSCAPNGNSGAGGGLSGGNGLNGDNPPNDAFGGTQVAGGAGGGGGGVAGVAGIGGTGDGNCLHCGGGGGGYFGGGAGGTDGHGGGGSGYVGGVANGSTAAGVQAGNGLVSISW